jgi:hypothetical protein
MAQGSKKAQSSDQGVYGFDEFLRLKRVKRAVSQSQERLELVDLNIAVADLNAFGVLDRHVVLAGPCA